MDEHYMNICCRFCNNVYSIKRTDNEDISKQFEVQRKFNSMHVKECKEKTKIPIGYICIGSISFSEKPEGKVLDVE